MKRACIAVVDAVRARLYTYQDESGQQLAEVADLVNPGRRLRGYPLDEPRDAQVDEMDLQFARDIVAEIDKIVHTGAFGHVIVVASPRMLGDLRKVDGVLHRPDLILDELPRDLAKLTSPQLHDKLAELKLIPPRQRLTFAQR